MLQCKQPQLIATQQGVANQLYPGAPPAMLLSTARATAK
jgi:hypothetical protein